MVVLGDRGMGKTRLVQELYRRLTTQYDPENYWPDASLFHGNNLRVAPEFSDPRTQAHFARFKMEERTMPFLWWGFRLTESQDRNAISVDLSAHRRTFDPHLAPLFFARRLAAAKDKLQATRREAGKSAVLKLIDLIPVLGPWLTGMLEASVQAKSGLKAWRHRRQLEAQYAEADLVTLETQDQADLLERTVADLTALHPKRGHRAGACDRVLR